LLEHVARFLIVRMVAGEKLGGAERFKGITDNGGCGFLGQAFSPVTCAQVDAQLINPLFRFARLKSAATGMLQIGQQKDRPILNAVGFHIGNFSIQSLLYLFRRERSAEISRDHGIPPERHGERQIVATPTAESESRCFQEVQLAMFIP